MARRRRRRDASASTFAAGVGGGTPVAPVAACRGRARPEAPAPRHAERPRRRPTRRAAAREAGEKLTFYQTLTAPLAPRPASTTKPRWPAARRAASALPRPAAEPRRPPRRRRAAAGAAREWPPRAADVRPCRSGAFKNRQPGRRRPAAACATAGSRPLVDHARRATARRATACGWAAFRARDEAEPGGRRGSRASGRLRHASSPPGSAMAGLTPAARGPAASCVSAGRDRGARGASWGRPSAATTPGRNPLLVGRPEGRGGLHSPTSSGPSAGPVAIDFMGLGLLRLGHPLARASVRAHRRPVAVDRGPGRDHRGGHHRHRADHRLPAPEPGHPPSPEPRPLRLLDKVARREVRRHRGLRGLRHPGRVRGGLRPRPRRTATATCPISPSWTAGREPAGRPPGARGAVAPWLYFARMNPFYKNLALWMVIGLIVILLFNLFQANQSPRGEIVFSDFLKKVETGEVREVTLRGNSVSGRLGDGSSFRTFTADYPDLVKSLKDRGVRIDGEAAGQQPVLLRDLPPVGADAALHRRVDLLHAPDAGRRRQGAVLRQGARAAHLREAEQGHLPGRGGRGRGQGRAAGDHRVPEGPAQVPEARRQDPEGRAPRRPARHRQDAPRQGHRRRGQRAVLLDLRARTSSRCSSAWAPRACATSSSRARSTRRASSSWTRSTRSAATAARASAAATTSASRR